MHGGDINKREQNQIVIETNAIGQNIPGIMMDKRGQQIQAINNDIREEQIIRIGVHKREQTNPKSYDNNENSKHINYLFYPKNNNLRKRISKFKYIIIL